MAEAIKPTVRLSARALADRARSIFKSYRWPTIESLSATDPLLIEIKNYASSVGADWKVILQKIATTGIADAGGITTDFWRAYQSGQTVAQQSVPAKTPTATVGGAIAEKEPASIAPQIPKAVMQAPTASNLTPSGTVQAPVSTTIPGQAPVIYQKPQEIAPSIRAQTGVALTPDANNFKIPAGTQTPEQNVDVNQGLNKLFPDVAQRHLQELQLARLPAGQYVQQEDARMKALQGQVQGATGATRQKAVGMLESQQRRSPFDMREKILADYQSGKIKPF